MDKMAVNTLGEFQVFNGKTVLNESTLRSVMLTKVLVYLIVNRQKSVSIEELTTTLWQEEEVDNPAGAIKNLMYRLRIDLKKELGGEDYILTNRGSYQWNSKYEIIIDIEELDKLHHMVNDTVVEIEQKVAYLERAIALYQGEFMPKLSDMHWVVTTSTYYHSLYLECVVNLAKIYLDLEKFGAMEEICNHAIQLDKLDTNMYYYMMLAQIHQKKYQLALETYEAACKVLREELGLRTPEELQKLYEQILSMNKSDKAEKFAVIQEDMVEEGVDGAFFCGYPIFKEIYRLSSRKAKRAKQDDFVCLLTLIPPENQEAKMAEFRINNAMGKLQNVIKNALRVGDVASQYSDSQFIILLPSCDYDNGILVANRILNNFYSANAKYRDIKISVSQEIVLEYINKINNRD